VPQQPQTMPLALSGVPQPQQIPVAAPAPVIPAPQPPPQVQIQQPQDPEAVQTAAIAREHALRQDAEGQFSSNSPASILATLSGIAGNVAGALTGKGDVGTQGVQYGDQLRQDAAQKQRQYMARVLEAEQKYKLEQKELTEIRNKQLRADSMVPLINRLGDTQLKAALFSHLAAGDVDGAQAALHQAEQDKRQRELDVFNRSLKTEQSEMSRERLDMAKQRAELDEKIKEIRLAQSTRNFLEQPKKEQEKIVRQESNEYRQQTAKLRGPVSAYVDVVQQLGDLEGPEAKERLNRILGAMGSARGMFTGTQEDKRLFQSLQKLFAQAKTEDFGQTMTTGEREVIAAGAGMKIGGGIFSNTLRNADNVIPTLLKLGEEMDAKLDSAGANKQEQTLSGFEKGGNYLTLKTFREAITDSKAIGGKNLDSTPPGVEPGIWAKLNRTQRVKFYKELTGATNAQ
jgi:hypothetical protein